MSLTSHPYLGITAAMATKHEKDKLIAPLFKDHGIEILLAPIDTDQLGTFSGEIPRVGTPHEVVIQKARLGMASGNFQFGLASEGSIGSDPSIPFLNSDIEVMAWIDAKNNFELVESFRSFEIVAQQKIVGPNDLIDEFLISADFPAHSLIVRSKESDGEIFKGINKRKDLDIALNKLLTEHKEVVIESDLRANHSPSRRKNIYALAERLVARLSNLCQICNTPGWGEVGKLFGLPCIECEEFSERAIKGFVCGCVRCDYRVEIVEEKKFVSAAECSSCNP